MEWYVIVLIVSSGVFLLTSVCLLLFGNMETDAGLDLDSGFTWGDLFSFKGLIHFTIGFSLTLTLMDGVTFLSAALGCITGVVFVLVLYYLYKLLFDKLQQNINYTTTITDAEAEVYFWDNNRKIGEVFITLEGRPVTVTLVYDKDIHLEKGRKIRVSGTRKSVSPIHPQYIESQRFKGYRNINYQLIIYNIYETYFYFQSCRRLLHDNDNGGANERKGYPRHRYGRDIRRRYRHDDASDSAEH